MQASPQSPAVNSAELQRSSNSSLLTPQNTQQNQPPSKSTLSDSPQSESRSVLQKDSVSISQEGSARERLATEKDQLAKDLSAQQERQVQQLVLRDAEVKAHERAHKAVGGQYAGSISYQYQVGPDGKRYAIGGEVSIDTSKVSGDPQATIDKMNVVKAAALAPADPSPQDRRVAASAAQAISAARVELATQAREERAQERESDSRQDAREAVQLRVNQRGLDSYSSVSILQDDESNTAKQFVDDLA